MVSATVVRGMLRTDALRLSRDRFLIGITVYFVGISFLVGKVLPRIIDAIGSGWNLDLDPYHSLIVSYLIVQLAPMVPGMIGGFLLLESREDGTVKALLVSPNPLTSYLLVVCIVMSLTAVILTVGQGAIIAFALPPLPALFAVGFAAAPAAPMLALLTAALAANKVQAFAYLKIFGLGPMLVIGAFFLPEPWQWLVAIYPPYCASKAYWVAEAGGSGWLLWAIAGLISSAVWFIFLQHLYLRAARK